jgi:hypothetical protein
MEYLIIAVVSIWAVEIFLRLPVRQAVNDLWRVSQKALQVVSSSHISDHWKEKVMLVYARKSFASTLKLAALILVFLSLTLMPIVVVDYLKLAEQPVLPLLATTKGLIASTVMAACYFWVRGRFVK